MKKGLAPRRREGFRRSSREAPAARGREFGPRRVLSSGDAVLKHVHFVEGAPQAMVESVRELGLEGVVAKYNGAPYQGGRTSLWRKLALRRPTKGWRVEQPVSWRAR